MLPSEIVGAQGSLFQGARQSSDAVGWRVHKDVGDILQASLHKIREAFAGIPAGMPVIHKK
jgi:hypothetical protein